jgi:hypothetical protein
MVVTHSTNISHTDHTLHCKPQRINNAIRKTACNFFPVPPASTAAASNDLSVPWILVGLSLLSTPFLSTYLTLYDSVAGIIASVADADCDD